MNCPRMHFEFLVFLLLITFTSCKLSLFKLEGEVTGQEFIYYKIMHPGNLVLMLESIEGDADIYVSEKNPSPTYHPDSYDFHSATCGTDSVSLLKTMKRPLVVGIYGYAAHNKFTLEVFQVPDGETNQFYEEEDLYREPIETVENTVSEKKEVRRSSTKVKKKFRNLPSGLWPILELFEMFFL